MSSEDLIASEPAVVPLLDRSGGHTTLDNPLMNQKSRPVPAWLWPVVTGLAALAAAYSVSCLWRVYLISQDMDVIRRMFDAPDSSDVARLNTLLASGRVANDVNTIMFFGLLIAFVAFVNRLPKVLARAGKPGALRGATAYRVWRIAIYASFALTILTTMTASQITDLSSYESNARHSIAYLLMRAALGAVYAWVFISLGSKATKALRAPVEPAPATATQVIEVAHTPE